MASGELQVIPPNFSEAHVTDTLPGKATSSYTWEGVENQRRTGEMCSSIVQAFLKG